MRGGRTLAAAYDVVTCGEAMVLFSPDTQGPLRHVALFRKYAAGAELNLSVALARLGLRTAFLTRLGDDEFGHHILSCMRAEGLDTSLVRLDPTRSTAVYFKEYRPLGDTCVYYYRRGSAASALGPEDLDPSWLEGARLVHLTGITPALSESCHLLCLRMLEAAREMGVPVSFDPNVRLKLVPREEVPRLMEPFMRQCRLLLLNEAELDLLFGTTDPGVAAPRAFEWGVEVLAVKRGARGGVALTGRGEVVSREGFRPARVVDPVGAGDGFDAGFVYGYLMGWPLERCLNLANLVGASATAVPGDYEGYPFRHEIDAYLG
ncbi:MAG TPA: sugar kinase, partial [Clostridiales bacterium]|nr:sugar kinase [Clostridiales bacterium]